MAREPRSLTNKVAVITGGGRGIGAATAALLINNGARVAIGDLDGALAKETASKLGSNAIGLELDVTDHAAFTAFLDQVERELGPIDILVNNAGLTRDNIVVRLKDEDWDAVMNANLRGAFVATRAASRGMMKRRWGRIINISSVVGLMGNKGQANYAASKAGLIALTKSVAKELGSRNVLVNAIAPGFIETEMTESMTEDARSGLTSMIPLERLGKPRDVSAMVAFLASEQASYITGQVFVIDGGMVM